VLIKVKVHPCLDLNFAGSRQKNRPQSSLDVRLLSNQNKLHGRSIDSSQQ
jgi:hypothetical protein